MWTCTISGRREASAVCEGWWQLAHQTRGLSGSANQPDSGSSTSCRQSAIRSGIGVIAPGARLGLRLPTASVAMNLKDVFNLLNDPALQSDSHEMKIMRIPSQQPVMVKHSNGTTS
jgi:hypothetical protein